AVVVFDRGDRSAAVVDESRAHAGITIEHVERAVGIARRRAARVAQARARRATDVDAVALLGAGLRAVAAKAAAAGERTSRRARERALLEPERQARLTVQARAVALFFGSVEHVVTASSAARSRVVAADRAAAERAAVVAERLAGRAVEICALAILRRGAHAIAAAVELTALVAAVAGGRVPVVARFGRVEHVVAAR